MRCQILERPGQITLQEVPQPTPGPGEIVVRVRAALTCGTDIKSFLRGHPKFPMPRPFGHEFAGEIAAVGAGVTAMREGDAVMAAPTGPCGECFFCERQQENLCETIMETMVHGAFADFVRLPARVVRNNVYTKHTDLDFPTAALLEPLACVMHGLEPATIREDATVVLIGAGAISLLHLLALKALGAGHILVIGRGQRRAEEARRLGADDVLAGGLEGANDWLRAATAGRGADLVIECTGQVDIWQQAIGLTRRGGHTILFGGCLPGTEVCIDTQRFHYDQLQITSPFHFTPRAVRRSYELLGNVNFGGERLVSDAYPLEDLHTALERHQQGDGVKFAIIP